MAGNKEYQTVMNYLYSKLFPDYQLPEYGTEQEVNLFKRIMNMIRDGELLRPDGTRFPAAIKTGDFIREMAANIKENNSLIRKTDSGYEYLSVNEEAAKKNINGLSLEEQVAALYNAPKKKEDARKPKFSVEEALACGDIIRSVSDLLQDLYKTDSFFSSDSKQYKEFKKALEKVESDLTKKPAIQSVDELRKILSQPIEIGSETMTLAGYTKEYELAKEAQPDTLSSRQISRLSICSRLSTIKDLVNSDRFENVKKKQKQDPCFIKEILEDKLAHKALLAKMKKAGPAAKTSVFTDPERYEKELAILKSNKGFTEAAKDLRSLEETLQKSGTALLDQFGIRPERSYDDAKSMLRQKTSYQQGKEYTNESVIAQYLVLRSSAMLQELQSSFSMTHSDAYYDFKNSLTDLREDLLNMDPKEITIENIQNALNSADLAAKAYQKQHANDRPDVEIAKRLSLAAEIRLYNSYIDNQISLENKPEISELLEQAYIHKCMKDEVINKAEEPDFDSLERFLFDKQAPQKAPVPEDPTQADLDFNKYFEELTDPDAYEQAVQEYSMTKNYAELKGKKGSVDFAHALLGKKIPAAQQAAAKNVGKQKPVKAQDEITKEISQSILGLK